MVMPLPRLFPARALATLVLIALALAGVPAAHALASDPAAAVIVQAASVDDAAQAVHAVGGTVDLSLPLIGGVAAHVDPQAVASLAAHGARAVPDAIVHPTAASYSANTVDPQVAALNPGPNLDPDAGDGSTVALIDTGVAVTPDLQGRVVRGLDLSGEGDGIDRYGHGTFMAGLIAGDGTASKNGPVRHVGVAPGATILSVKVAGADGSTTVGKVIAGIGWVVMHRDDYGVDVINLSFGVDSPLPYLLNPLSTAVEAAWASGITVVVAAGNDGRAGVSSPGDDPYVLTVGATDTRGTARTNDDIVPGWSGRQRVVGLAKPDVVAPGVSVVSLRAPGSTIDAQHPEGRIDATYFRGSGTSMSTALVSGAAAIVMAHHPNATPDDVKGAIVDSADRTADGAQAVDLAGADRATPQADWWQHYPVALGLWGFGLLTGMPWNGTRWSNDFWSATRWKATRWSATRWSDEFWSATRWKATRWSDLDWAATRWSATRWSAEAWPSATWG
jgi:serine protease AprX